MPMVSVRVQEGVCREVAEAVCLQILRVCLCGGMAYQWHARGSRSSHKPLHVIITRLSTTCNQAPCPAAGAQDERSAATAVFEETAMDPQTPAPLAVGIPPAAVVPVTATGSPAPMVTSAVDTGLQVPGAATGGSRTAATTSPTAGSNL